LYMCYLNIYPQDVDYFTIVGVDEDILLF